MKLLLTLSIIIGLTIHYVTAIGVDEQPHQVTSLRGLAKRKSKSKSKKGQSCQESHDLKEFAQWREEVGYWIGDLTFYGSDGAPSENTGWNYRYDNYKGFITGDISG